MKSIYKDGKSYCGNCGKIMELIEIDNPSNSKLGKEVYKCISCERTLLVPFANPYYRIKWQCDSDGVYNGFLK